MKFETFMNHAMFNKKNPYIRMEGVHHKMMDRFVCPNCSGLTLTDTRASDAFARFQTCPVCGWHGPKNATLTLREAYEKQTVTKNGTRYLR